MATYLVMKNNLKRIFTTKFTYLIMLFTPVAVSFIGASSGALSNKDIQVGILCEKEEFHSMTDHLGSYEGIQYEWADAKTKHTDMITGKYQYLIDGKIETKKDAKNPMAEISRTSRYQGKEESKSDTGTEQKSALLLTAYMMIAALYASRMIRDQNNGMVERYCMAGYAKIKYYGGYMASTWIVIIGQIFFSIGIMRLFDRGYTISAVQAAGGVVFMATVASAFGVLIAAILKSELHANILASSTIAILSLLGGTFVPVAQMPEALQILSILSPIRWLHLVIW